MATPSLCFLLSSLGKRERLALELEDMGEEEREEDEEFLPFLDSLGILKPFFVVEGLADPVLAGSGDSVGSYAEKR